MKALTKDQKKAVISLAVRYETYQEAFCNYAALEDDFLIEGEKYRAANSLNAWASMLRKQQRLLDIELVEENIIETWMRSSARYINETERSEEARTGAPHRPQRQFARELS